MYSLEPFHGPHGKVRSSCAAQESCVESRSISKRGHVLMGAVMQPYRSTALFSFNISYCFVQ